jgi:hypothetical protein
MSRWVRLWDDMPTDPKWRVVSRRSGRPLSEVIAVFVFMLTAADASTGALDGFDDEDVGAALDIDPEAVAAIRSAMEGKVIGNGRLSGWERRQPKRPDDQSTDRVRAFRDRKRTDETQRNAPETHGNAPEEKREETDTEREGRSARVRALIPLKMIFPRDGTIEFTAWADIARKNCPGADVDSLSNRFRGWCMERGIEFDAPGIEKTFATFCQKSKTRSFA